MSRRSRVAVADLEPSAPNHSVRNTAEACACGHAGDQHYLGAPRVCRVTGCTCAGHAIVDQVAPATQPTAPTSGGLWCPMPVASIDASPLNPRKHFAQEDLDALAASLDADGLLQPIVVKKVLHTGGGIVGGDRYEIVAGERRWRAAKQLGWTEIPAIIRDNVDEQTHLRLALLENLARTDLDPLEEAEGYRQLNDMGMTQAAIAAAVHRSQPAVANAIRLLRAPHEILDRLDSGQLSVSHVLALLKYEQFPAVMRKLAEIAVDEDLNTKDLEGGIPNAYELVREGLLRDLNRRTFDKKVCDSCPFDARRKGDNGWSDYCLKPEHFDQLEAEAQNALAAKAKKQLEKATATGKQVPKLDKLPYGSFERIGSRAPEGCSEACACRGAGTGYGGQIEEICTDPKRFRRLTTAAQREDAKAKKKVLNELLDRLNDKLEAVEEIGDRELAILATAALQWLTAPDLREAVKWTGGLIEVKDLEDRLQRDELPQKLAAVAPLDLVRMTVYAVIHHELRDALQGYGNGKKPRADWYLADQPPRPTGTPLVEAFAASGAAPAPKGRGKRSRTAAYLEEEASIDELGEIFTEAAEREYELAGATA